MSKRYNTIYVTRDERCTDEGMLGHILIPEKRADGKWIMRKFSTLELPWKSNAQRISAIPDGTYNIIQRTWGGYYKRYSERFQHEFVCEVADVPGRSAILLHIGNWVKDSRGCILVGYPAKNRAEGQEKMVANSTQAYKIFYDLVRALFAMYGSVQLVVQTAGSESCKV